MSRVWQKKACVPYVIPASSLCTAVNVKTYSGDNENDCPEFSEVSQIPMKLRSVMNTQSPYLQFKVDLDTQTEKYFPGLRDTTVCTAREFCNMPLLGVNTRISGCNWKFPMHFDAGDQIILHHYGVKRWRILDRWWTCEPGDVLFIQAGVWHAVENDKMNGACMISNAQFHNWRTERLAVKFDAMYGNRKRDIMNRRDTFKLASSIP